MPIMQVGGPRYQWMAKCLPGVLEPRALQFVREWAKLRQDEILANWERARRNEPLHASSRCRGMGL